MRYTRIYNREDGSSAFEECELPLIDRGAIGRISEPVAVQSLMFRETPADHHHDWHNAPQRQFIILLDGEIEITVSGGESRRFKGGEVLLVEDCEGEGHLTRHVVQELRHSLFIPLPEENS